MLDILSEKLPRGIISTSTVLTLYKALVLVITTGSLKISKLMTWEKQENEGYSFPKIPHMPGIFDY